MYKLARRKNNRIKRKIKIRSKLFGSSERPRISVLRTNKYIYAQAIDDVQGVTLAHIRGPKDVKNAFESGKNFATKLKEKNIKDAVFDRNGYIYHGKVKSFADGIREGGVNL